MLRLGRCTVEAIDDAGAECARRRSGRRGGGGPGAGAPLDVLRVHGIKVVLEDEALCGSGECPAGTQLEATLPQIRQAQVAPLLDAHGGGAELGEDLQLPGRHMLEPLTRLCKEGPRHTVARLLQQRRRLQAVEVCGEDANEMQEDRRLHGFQPAKHNTAYRCQDDESAAAAQGHKGGCHICQRLSRKLLEAGHHLWERGGEELHDLRRRPRCPHVAWPEDLGGRKRRRGDLHWLEATQLAAALWEQRQDCGARHRVLGPESGDCPEDVR
mmetsp:Transcript_37327/g.79297  ORF Transcript_37327/g.79297 Transcript_37327/m.79297 type:complete len:270 (-) Transcript_37327:961-1770(-)